MPRTWDHPDLGRLTYDLGWFGKVDAPGFAAFSLDARASERPYELYVAADSESDIPSGAALAILLKVLSAQAELVPKIVEALWNDFNGRGPDSGMWWHGDLASVVWAVESDHLSPPAAPEDLLKMLRLETIVVRKDVYKNAQPIVELSFDAAFEVEHGVGILTDGESICGAGYIGGVMPYKADAKT